MQRKIGYNSTVRLTSQERAWHWSHEVLLQRVAVLVTTGHRPSHRKSPASSVALEPAQGLGVTDTVCGGLVSEKRSVPRFPSFGVGWPGTILKEGLVFESFLMQVSVNKRGVIMRQGAREHTVVMSGYIDWGTSGVEQVQACPAPSPPESTGIISGFHT